VNRKTEDWEHIVGTETTICSENNLPTVIVFWGEEKNEKNFR